MTKKLKLTAELLDRITKPEDGKPYRIYDKDTKYLVAQVSKTGAVSLKIIRRINGTLIREPVCNWGEMGLKDARKIAEQINAKLAVGESPKAKSKAERESITLREAFDAYIESVKHKNRSWQDTQQKYLYYLSRYDNRSLMSMNSFDISKILSPYLKSGKNATYLRLRQILSKTYNHAIKELFYTGTNPVKLVDRPADKHKERFLTESEIEALIKSVEQEKEPYPSVIKLLLFLGLRIDNCVGMKWEWINFNTKTITIPAEHYKTKRTKTLPLNPLALSVLEKRAENKQHPIYVFPRMGRKQGDRPYMGRPKHIWKKVLERAGLENVRFHDCRHTFISLLMKTNCPMFKAMLLAGHERITTTQKYSHLNVEETRNESDKAFKFLEK